MAMHGLDAQPTPNGELTLQTLSMPADTNPYGDIFGGWLMSQMDIGGAILAQQIARGRITTVAVGNMAFLRPVPVGATVSVYADVTDVGRSSMHITIEVWIKIATTGEVAKVTEGEFIYVAIDDNGRTRPVPRK